MNRTVSKDHWKFPQFKNCIGCGDLTALNTNGKPECNGCYVKRMKQQKICSKCGHALNSMYLDDTDDVLTENCIFCKCDNHSEVDKDAS